MAVRAHSFIANLIALTNDISNDQPQNIENKGACHGRHRRYRLKRGVGVGHCNEGGGPQTQRH